VVKQQLLWTIFLKTISNIVTFQVYFSSLQTKLGVSDFFIVLLSLILKGICTENYVHENTRDEYLLVKAS